MFSQRYGKHVVAFSKDIFALFICYAYICCSKNNQDICVLSKSDSVPISILDKR